jgi:hypothetical protein
METKNIRYVWFLGVVCCIMSFSKVSSSCFIPRMCQDSKNLPAYDLGYLKGKNIIDSAWNGIDQDCSELLGCDGFKKTVVSAVNSLFLMPGASEFVVCHYQGYIRGAIERLKEIEYLCAHCVMDGELVGHLAAIFYCQLSFAFRGLSVESDMMKDAFFLCNQSMVESCFETFVTTASNFTNIFGMSCAPYTQGEYSTVFDHVKESQCIPHPQAAE